MDTFDNVYLIVCTCQAGLSGGVGKGAGYSCNVFQGSGSNPEPSIIQKMFINLRYGTSYTTSTAMYWPWRNG